MAAKNKGIVYLVGAGPGDIGLLTMRGWDLLRDADLVVYDGLVNPLILNFAPQAEKILIGKVKNNLPPGKQGEIHRVLLAASRQGKTVVRLKGGDPFVFGRGGEEADFLHQKKIPFELVPGVSSGHAVPAYAGIPVTDRRLASSVTFVTAHEAEPKNTSLVHWEALAKLHGTLVFFMGLNNLNFATEQLIRFGKSKSTQVSVIQWGTLPKQRVVEGNLATISKKVKAAGLGAPTITVVGAVNEFRRKLQWFSPHGGPGRPTARKPLLGKRILITRASGQAEPLRLALEKEGAWVVDAPGIRIEPPKDFGPLDEAVGNLRGFDWVLFTSVNGARFFFDRLEKSGRDTRALAGIRIGAVGSSTTDFLLQKGIQPDLVPTQFTGEALFHALKSRGFVRGLRFLLPRTDIAPDLLRESLKREGAWVTEVIAYRTVLPNPRERRVLTALLTGKQAPDFVTVTSASTVRSLFADLDKSELKKIKSRIISIGPVTSQALRDLKLEPFVEAKEHTIPGMVRALVASL